MSAVTCRPNWARIPNRYTLPYVALQLKIVATILVQDPILICIRHLLKYLMYYKYDMMLIII